MFHHVHSSFAAIAAFGFDNWRESLLFPAMSKEAEKNLWRTVPRTRAEDAE